MKTLGSIRNFESFYFKASVTPRVPNSGFSFAFGSTGAGSFATGIIFSGVSGLVFDQSGNFFGGYQSGRSLQIEGHFFGDRLSYFYNGSLVNNNIPISNDFDTIEFNKLGDSELNVELNYISGERIVSEEGLADNAGIFLISSDNFYILPSL